MCVILLVFSSDLLGLADDFAVLGLNGSHDYLLLGDGFVVVSLRLLWSHALFARVVVLLLTLIQVVDSRFLAFEKLSVGGDLEIERDLDAHELLVLSELIGHLALELLELLLHLSELVLEVTELASVSVLHLVHGVSESVVSASEGLDFDLESLLSLSVLVDLVLSVSERGRVASRVFVGLLNLGVGPLVHLVSVLLGESLVVLSHSVEFGHQVWAWSSFDLDRLTLSELFSELSDLLLVASSEEFDLLNGGLESTLEVGSHEGGVVAVLSEGGYLLLELLAKSVLVVVLVSPLSGVLGQVVSGEFGTVFDIRDLVHLGSKSSHLLLVHFLDVGWSYILELVEFGFEGFVLDFEASYLLDVGGESVVEVLQVFLLVGSLREELWAELGRHRVDVLLGDATVVGSSRSAAVLGAGRVLSPGGWSLRLRCAHKRWAGVIGLSGHAWGVSASVARCLDNFFGVV